jgi:hypothetical protein
MFLKLLFVVAVIFAMVLINSSDLSNEGVLIPPRCACCRG